MMSFTSFTFTKDQWPGEKPFLPIHKKRPGILRQATIETKGTSAIH